jgi:uncharacterized protein YdeI (YjbR/CyaY-like superfamily)
MELYKDLPVLFFATQGEWRDWLDSNYTDTGGVWLKFAKKATGIESLNHDQALDEALCYGWIDGQAAPYAEDGERYYLQKFTPRRARSMWSKRNIQKVTELIAAGKMQPSGQAEIDRAKADGRWEQAYDMPSQMTIPEDFAAELEKHPKAKAFYATLNKTNTYAILWRLQTAKKPETRLARMTKLIAMLDEGKKLH